MAEELEAAALESVAQALPAAGSPGEAPAPGAREGARCCANCATPLQGPWCHRCGQAERDYHRSAWHLLVEFVESVLHVDGRLWRTIPSLLLHPARLTRDYVDGHRASQVPPLRMFLVLLLLLFVSGAVGDMRIGQVPESESHAAAMTAEERADLQRAREAIAGARATPQGAAVVGAEERVDHWLRERLQPAFAHPGEFRLIVEQWSERFAFLMLPIAALLLKLLFMRRPDLWLFDHLVFAMHSLSFQCLVLATLVLGEGVLPGAIESGLLLVSPVHLFAHMRGFYRTGTGATLWRMALLGLGSAVAAILLALGLLAIGVWKTAAA